MPSFCEFKVGHHGVELDRESHCLRRAPFYSDSRETSQSWGNLVRLLGNSGVARRNIGAAACVVFGSLFFWKDCSCFGEGFVDEEPQGSMWKMFVQAVLVSTEVEVIALK